MSAWEKLTESERLILRDCYGVLRLTGRSFSLMEDDLGDLILGMRRSEMTPIRTELESLQDELSTMGARLQELRGRLQVLSTVPSPEVLRAASKTSKSK